MYYIWTQIDKLRNRIYEKEDLIEKISSKAARRIHVLEANWNKAESELCRLDELLENVRTVLGDHPLVKDDSKLTKLLAVVDGRESARSLKKESKTSSEMFEWQENYSIKYMYSIRTYVLKAWYVPFIQKG